MTLRRATAADARAIAVLLRTTFRASLPFVPDLHTPEADLAYVANRLLPSTTCWLAEQAGVLQGYVAFRDDWIDHLYVHPDWQGQGVGRDLLAKALEDGAPKQLWTFQRNARARRFYEARGFRPVEFTDGSGNMEKTPDVRYVWNSVPARP